ncbi:MAG: hypothetical protein V3S89_01595 [Desulfobacterales bacterium]
MDKIVILSDDEERYLNLIDYLEDVFPECEISLQSARGTRLFSDAQTEGLPPQ